MVPRDRGGSTITSLLKDIRLAGFFGGQCGVHRYGSSSFHEIRSGSVCLDGRTHLDYRTDRDRSLGNIDAFGNVHYTLLPSSFFV